MNFTEVESVLPVMITGKAFPCLYLNPQAKSCSFLFSTPSLGGWMWGGYQNRWMKVWLLAKAKSQMLPGLKLLQRLFSKTKTFTNLNSKGNPKYPSTESAN